MKYLVSANYSNNTVQ